MREDWIECKVESISEYLRGITYKKENASDKELNGMFPILRANNIKDDKINFDDLVFVDKNLINSNQILRKNDILFAMSSGSIHLVGKSAFINDDLQFSFGAFCGVLRPNSYINAKYLSSYFSSLGFKNYISTVAKGSNINNLKREHLLNIQLPLPTLPEQRAIVKKLESLFSSLDAGVADLKKAQQQLKIYRQAVLKKAFEGECFQKLENIILNSQNGLSKRNSENGTEFKVLRLADVYKQQISYTSPRTIRLVETEINKYLLRSNDLLIIRVNGSIDLVGRFIHINNQDQLAEWAFCDHFIQLRISDTYNAKYLFFYTQLIAVRNYINENMVSSAGQNTVNQNTIKNLLVPDVDISKQHQIVKQIESRLSVCDSIEQNIKESLAKSEALRQSILKKAFEGNLLTAQELAACKQAADYEPASVLLDRVKAEQNKATAKPSKKKVAEPLVVAKTETPVAKISADIHAGLIAKVIKIHEENPASIDNLSHIKCEKIAHLVEYHLQIPLGRKPVKDAAGPDDYPHLKKIEHRAKMANYFAIQKKDIGYSYSSTKNSDKAIEKFQSALSVEKNKQLDDLIALFLEFDLEASEIIATTYAGWNNLILCGNANPSDEEIVYESRENWSDRKLTIARERFFKAIEWMRKNQIVPTGYGTVVPFPKKKKS
ncbi:MAG: type I restriction endonuclease subunit S [Pedobacter sp.]|nr:MAG: type I restriction endonuclease subunit S [Pedobacter sp.]